MEREKNEPHPYIITVLLIGIFGGGFCMFYFGARTFILMKEIVLIALAGGIAALGIHYLLLSKWKRYFIEVALYNFLGWGSIICALILALNYFIYSEPYEKIYELKSGKVIYIKEYMLSDDEGEITGAPVTIDVDDKLFDDFPRMLTFEADEIKSAEAVTEAWFTIADGLFGYKILLKKELH